MRSKRSPLVAVIDQTDIVRSKNPAISDLGSVAKGRSALSSVKQEGRKVLA
jgi:hypothetical protein